MYGELYHHGIKGQRWGIRRYQNEDGTLTASGKRRYGKTISDYNRYYNKGMKEGLGSYTSSEYADSQKRKYWDS